MVLGLCAANTVGFLGTVSVYTFPPLCSQVSLLGTNTPLLLHRQSNPRSPHPTPPPPPIHLHPAPLLCASIGYRWHHWRWHLLRIQTILTLFLGYLYRHFIVLLPREILSPYQPTRVLGGFWTPEVLGIEGGNQEDVN